MKIDELIDKLGDALVHGKAAPEGGTILSDESIEHVCHALRIIQILAKPVPVDKRAEPTDPEKAYDQAFNHGWNACANAIAKEIQR